MNKMMVVTVCIFTFLVVGCASDKERANLMFVEATAIIEQARSLDKKDFSASLEAYERAKSLLSKIVAEYAATDLAVKIASDEIKIDSISLSDLKNTIIPNLHNSITIAEDPLSLATKIALELKVHQEACKFLEEVGLRYIELKMWTEANHLLSVIDCKLERNALLANVQLSKVIDGQSVDLDEFDRNISEYAAQLSDPFSKLNKYKVIADAYIKLGESAKAKIYIDKAVGVLEERSIINAVLDYYSSLTSYYYKIMDEKAAVDLIEKAKTKIDGRWAYFRDRDIAAAWESIRKPEKAFDELYKIPIGFYRDLCLREMGLEFARSGDFEEAMRCVQIIDSDNNSMKIDVLVKIIEEKLNLKDLEGANNTLKQALDKMSLPEYRGKANNYSDIANIFTKLGDDKNASVYAIKSYKEYIDNNEKLYGFPGNMFYSLVGTKNFEYALEVINSLQVKFQDEVYFEYALSDIAQAQAVLKRYDDADVTLLKISDRLLRYQAASKVLFEAFKVKDVLSVEDLNALNKISFMFM